MSTQPLHVGIDLGTTNSAAAVFDGERVTLVRNRQGSALTPSVVRIDARGNVIVGERARRFLDTDPDNTRSEFKRLMGTSQRLSFAAAAVSKSPPDLAAEVLRSLRSDIADQVGVLPERAVISVPALFELPQITATSEAARLAGFERIEVLQEPVASAIATGWSLEDPGRTWLVYDLGGGTFDVSLLQMRDGLLRIAGHDGDNFLGGRDFDAAIVRWVLTQGADRLGAGFDPADPAHAVGLRRLRHAAEEAKIELARATEAAIVVTGCFTVGGAAIDIEAWLDRATLDQLVARLVDRSIEVCLRLLVANGLQPPDLDRIVLVGGPTAMPAVRDRVAAVLGAPFGSGLDPMTLVATGAALYAGTAGLDARPQGASVPVTGPRVWLQYPAVSSDPGPYVVGRVLERGDVVAIRLERADGSWQSAIEPLDDEGAFAVPVSLVLRQINHFELVGYTADARAVPVHPASFRIVHGITISDPPLSRTIGVALADDTVHVYVDRGSPLPMRRTFTHRTIQTVTRGAGDDVLKIPIVQGEFGRAHLCRVVGTLVIPGDSVKDVLPAGSEIEVSIELDRGGRLAARAYVPALERTFEEVAQLLAPEMSVPAMEASLSELLRRTGDAAMHASRSGNTAAVGRVERARELLRTVGEDVKSARAGDADAGEKARRALLEVDGALAELEADRAWPEAVNRARSEVLDAAVWVGQFGDELERRALREAEARIEQLITARQAGDLEREVRAVGRLAVTAYYRAPGSWDHQFQAAAGRVSEATDLKRAQELVSRGRAAIARGDRAEVEAVVRGLWALLPPEADERRMSHDSGIR